jgi:uncharacterized protein (DUF2141 family)
MMTDRYIKTGGLGPRGVWKVILFASFLLMIGRCAHPVMPTGGIKDIIPPEPVSSEPGNYTTRFSGNRVIIHFDEFIQMKDPAKEIFISPPFSKRPEFKVKGKSLEVEFQEPLQPDRTYTIYFGKSIVDLTEGNPLEGYEYVFSTGDVIDSLSISGEVVDAFDLKPVGGILAVVYLDNNDTIPFDSLPVSVPPISASRSLSDGKFSINNLSPGEYKLVAIEDQNNNFYHDLPSERFGFLHGTVSPVYVRKFHVHPDTLADSITTVTESVPLPGEKKHTICLFSIPDSVQRLMGKTISGREKIAYFFRFPVSGIEVTPINFTADSGAWCLEDFSSRRDTLNLWLVPPLPDTLSVNLKADNLINDTSRFIQRGEAEQSPAPRRKRDHQHQLLVTSPTAPVKELNRDFILLFSSPVERIDTGRIVLAGPKDTLCPQIVIADPVRRRITVRHPWKDGESYRLTVPDSVAWSVSGMTNRQTELKFKVRPMDEYGTIILTYRIEPGIWPYIIQFMNEKEAVMKTDIIFNGSVIRYEYLIPGKYKIKAIADLNSNGQWDTGNYLLGRLPEPVHYCPLDLNVRANWELQEEWELERLLP